MPRRDQCYPIRSDSIWPDLIWPDPSDVNWNVVLKYGLSMAARRLPNCTLARSPSLLACWHREYCSVMKWSRVAQELRWRTEKRICKIMMIVEWQPAGIKEIRYEHRIWIQKIDPAPVDSISWGPLWMMLLRTPCDLQTDGPDENQK
jgi:hypothetical protein